MFIISLSYIVRGPIDHPIPAATFLNDLSRRTRERINRTEGLSHQRITYAAVFFYESAAY